MTNIAMAALRHIGQALADTYRRGGRALVAAPALVALAAVPEFVQHVAEIRMGMFVSVAQARAIANSATRWEFGYVKLAGFALAILLIARFWATGSVRRAVLIPPFALGRMLLALAVLLASGFALERLGAIVQVQPLRGALTLLSWMTQLAAMNWLVAALIDDRETTFVTAFTRRLPTAALLFVLLAAAFVPAQALHGLDHRLALGRPEPLVWLLMIWDALVVGLMAALVGSALFVGAAKRGAGDARPLRASPADGAR